MISTSNFWQHTQRFVLSLPMQVVLLVSLCMIILWTLYFSTYPPVHDALHETRHHTLTVPCH
ncbi:CbtB domain-containing protein [Stanieria cyanosphaera]|uniref:CbtB domain-containing protein n=1 Tax=Stanieria cyanosphaera TaxID=102116 RepID=UPI001FE08FAF|nr:CbtB domain-containing protein [Stanieria cyanosphaera]